MKQEAIKILIADDHDIIRQGLKRIISLEQDIEVICEAPNGEAALNLITQNNELDIVLLDAKMPIMNGIEVLEAIKKDKNKIKVIMLTVENDRETIHKAIDIGADGYMLKDSAGEEIVNAIRLVHSGEKYIDKSLVSVLFQDIKSSSHKEPSVLDNLSKREVEVLIKISKGLSNKQIGEHLYLSEKTVKNYATNIFRKIEVEDRVQATIFAINHNIDKYYENKFRD